MLTSKHQQHTDHDCSGCAGALRNRYFRGKQMKAEEFKAEQDYTLRQRRLVNRAVLGWGVVQGLGLEGPRDAAPPAAAAEPLKVLPGLALDKYGREIVLPDTVVLGLSNLVVLESKGSSVELSPRPLAALEAGLYVLSVHYAERLLGDVELPDGCGCSRIEKRFVCETALFSLQRLPSGCPCGEEPCERPHHCEPDACRTTGRGPHAALTRWVARADPIEKAPGPLAWRDGLCLDPHAAVALGCVTVKPTGDACKPVALAVRDGSSPRRLVKNNDLLYDLLRGCDLTTIEKISWAKWHRNTDAMPYQEFLKVFNRQGKVPHRDSKDPVETDLHVEFSRPVAADTLRPDCFSLRFVVRSQDTGWREVREVPVVRVELLKAQDIGHLKTACGARLYVPPYWVREVSDSPSVMEHDDVTVEILVHGDFILDCLGQPIDANARGFALRNEPSHSGNGSPGGTFRSVFHVGCIRPNR